MGQTTGDGLRTTFRVIDSGANTQHLYISPTDGSSPAQRLNQAPDIEKVGAWQFTPDETRVIYRTSSPSNSFAGGVYSVSATNPTGDHFRISSDAANSFTAIYDALLTSSGDRVIYHGFLNSSTAVDLFGASTTQPGTQIQLNTRLVEHGDVNSVTLIEGGERVVYRGDMDTQSFYELYSADTDQAGTQVRISGPVASNGGSIFAYQLTPDEAHAVYTKVSPGRSTRDLFSASTSVAESEVVLLLSDTYTAIERLSTDASSDWVVAHVETTSPADVTRDWLFAVPIDGGVPVRLSNRLPEHGEIREWEFAPNGLNVVYAADLVVRAEEVPYCPGGGRGGCNPPGTQTVFVGSPELYVTQLPIFGGQLGDMDGDGVVDADDLQPFALGIVNPQNFAFQFGLGPVNFGDMNRDGAFDESDASLFASVAGVSIEELLAAVAAAGDYNNDGVVNAADYTVWRDARGSPAGSLPNDIDGGAIGDAQYSTWKVNFGSGQVDGDGLSATAPEPGTFVLIAYGIACALAVRRPSRPAT
jgi:hypothetical protein